MTMKKRLYQVQKMDTVCINLDRLPASMYIVHLVSRIRYLCPTIYFHSFISPNFPLSISPSLHPSVRASLSPFLPPSV